jgi:hypothetical protein
VHGTSETVRVEPLEPRPLLKILLGIGGHHAHSTDGSNAFRTSTVDEDRAWDRWAIRFLEAFDVIAHFLQWRSNQ